MRKPVTEETRQRARCLALMRKEAGWTQGCLAAVLEIPTSTYSHYELGLCNYPDGLPARIETIVRTQEPPGDLRRETGSRTLRMLREKYPQFHKMAGSKGGTATAQNRQHMVQIGKKGGQKVAQDREHMERMRRRSAEVRRQRALLTQAEKPLCRECNDRPVALRGLCQRCYSRLRYHGQMAPIPPRTHCKNGHELTPDNVILKANGYRQCRPCQRQYALASQHRRRGKL